VLQKILEERQTLLDAKIMQLNSCVKYFDKLKKLKEEN